MRLRFFAIILTVLVLSTAAVIYVHVYYFRDEPLEFVSKQIESSSESLLKTPIVHWTDFSNRALVGKIISDTLGDKRVGKIFLIRDRKKILFRNFEVPLLNEELPIEPGMHSLEVGTNFIRIYNVEIPGEPGRILQTGEVIDSSLLDWNVIDIRIVMFLGLSMALLFIVAIFLTFLLLSPMRLMNAHLKEATADLKNLKDVAPLPANLIRIGQNPWSKNDDFAQLVGSIQRLIERINANYRLTRSWTFQMAHELKTPLTVLRTEIEVGVRKDEIDQARANSLLAEIDYISEVITQFLDWADIENSTVDRSIHAVHLSSVVINLKTKFDKIYPDRLQVRLNRDPLVLSNPLHLEQVVNNLVMNSLKYSPADSTVDLLVEGNELRVVDRGSGIPRGVMDRLGEPFNFGPDSKQNDLKGNGLGLAWVSSVAKIYNWNLHVRSSNRGTDVSIQFPSEN